MQVCVVVPVVVVVVCEGCGSCARGVLAWLQVVGVVNRNGTVPTRVLRDLIPLCLNLNLKPSNKCKPICTCARPAV